MLHALLALPTVVAVVDAVFTDLVNRPFPCAISGKLSSIPI